MIGSVSTLLRLSEGLLPKITRSVVGKVISIYLKGAEEIDKTDGNIFDTVNYGNSVYGGWGLPGKPKAHRKYIAAGFLVATTLSFLLLRKK